MEGISNRRLLRLGVVPLALCVALGVANAQNPPPDLTRPVTIASGAGGKNYINLSLDALLAAGGSSEPDLGGLQLGAHDPSRRGFTVQNVELVFSGAVDPYFTASANIVFVELPDGETETEVEEIYATTSSLPHNLQVRAGHFYTEFGRLNPQHPHTWDFVDAPLVMPRMFGPDGLRSSGARIAWLMPTPFYSELMLAVQNAFGETLYSFGSVEGEELFGRSLVGGSVSNLGDMLYTPRYSASLDVTDTQTLVVGASAALGPNGTGGDGDTSITGIDAYWKWKSARAHQGFPFVKVQVEALKRRYRAVDPDRTFDDNGTYAQVVWGFTRGWTAGLRQDHVGGDEAPDPDPYTETRDRSTAAVTWYPTEYSKLRLQYSHDRRDQFDDADSLWLQFEFILGAHAAHKF